MRLDGGTWIRTMRTVCFALVALLIATPASGDLMVYEYVAGQKVTLDTVTGYHWYWNMDDFTNMTYSEQITTISGLGTYGNIAGGWHMATWEEMLTLWDHPEAVMGGGFAGPRPWYTPEYVVGWGARYDYEIPDGGPWGTHAGAGFGWDTIHEVWCFKTDLSNPWSEQVSDLHSGYSVSAWVVSTHPVVPLPGAALLGVVGLGYAGLRLRRRIWGRLAVRN